MRTKENAECEILYVSWCIHVSVYKETSRNLISIVLWVCDKLADSKFVCLVHIRVYPHRNSKLTLDVCNSACLCITLPVSRVQPVSNILWMFTCFIISDNQFFTCVIRASSSQNFPYVHLHRRTSTYAFVMFFPHTCTYRNTWRRKCCFPWLHRRILCDKRQLRSNRTFFSTYITSACRLSVIDEKMRGSRDSSGVHLAIKIITLCVVKWLNVV